MLTGCTARSAKLYGTTLSRWKPDIPLSSLDQLLRNIYTRATMSWTCDSCGEEIQTADQGYVEWFTRTDGQGHRIGRDLRLVHHAPASPRQPDANCYRDEAHERRQDGSAVRTYPLRQFLGHDGLMLLFSMLSEDEAPKVELLELAKRIHIPGYEEARPHFRTAMDEGVFAPNMPDGYYWQQQIRAVLEWVRAGGAND
jgi:hypothetical protein